MKVAVTITVTDGYDTAVELSKSATVDQPLAELDEIYPRPPRVKGYGSASIVVSETARLLTVEAANKLRDLHEQDCRRVDRANAKIADDAEVEA